MYDIFLIISVIDARESPLSYSKTRSIYTKEQRLIQTEKTILSIKKYVPDSKIFLFEAGQSDYENNFSKQVDKYFYVGDKYLIRNMVNSKFKGIGEISIILKALKLLKENKLLNNFELVFKISGRYTINSNFNRKNWISNKFNFLKINNCYSTRLYAIPRSSINYYKIISIMTIPFLIFRISIEKIFYKLIDIKKINIIKILGLSGEVAIDGNKINE